MTTDTNPEAVATVQDPVAAFRPLAQLLIHQDPQAAPIAEQDDWVEPLAQVLEALSRGVGHLDAATVCGSRDPESRPQHLLAIEGSRILLPRLAGAWQAIRDWVRTAMTETTTRFDDEQVRKALDAIFPRHQETTDQGRVLVDNIHQRLAAAHLVDARVGVLTGGPGTGKTTSAAALIALRLRLDHRLTADDVVVAAPTGKAANRLRQSLTSAAARLSLSERETSILQALRPSTLHRVLGWTPKPRENGGPWRYHASNPLRAQLVIIDESSMADLELAAAVIHALPTGATLVFLGDRDQLDSVDAGGVLAELVARGSRSELNPDQVKRLKQRVGTDAARHWREGLPTMDGLPAADDDLPGLAVGLKWSYRAKSAPWILDLANLVRPGSPGTVAAIRSRCEAAAVTELAWCSSRKQIDEACAAAWLHLATVAAQWSAASPPSPDQLQEVLDRFQLIVGTNHQVDHANDWGLQLLGTGKHIPRSRWTPGHQAARPLVHGTPIMVETNDRQLDLSNGDLGVALGAGSRKPAQVACFPGLLQPIPLARLPQYRPAFAITIHKSQGSEWQTVAIDLPERVQHLLDRRLVYTAITRASKTVFIHASQDTLEAIIGD